MSLLAAAQDNSASILKPLSLDETFEITLITAPQTHTRLQYHQSKIEMIQPPNVIPSASSERSHNQMNPQTVMMHEHEHSSPKSHNYNNNNENNPFVPIDNPKKNRQLAHKGRATSSLSPSQRRLQQPSIDTVSVHQSPRSLGAPPSSFHEEFDFQATNFGPKSSTFSLSPPTSGLVPSMYDAISLTTNGSLFGNSSSSRGVAAAASAGQLTHRQSVPVSNSQGTARYKLGSRAAGPLSISVPTGTSSVSSRTPTYGHQFALRRLREKAQSHTANDPHTRSTNAHTHLNTDNRLSLRDPTSTASRSHTHTTSQRTHGSPVGGGGGFTSSTQKNSSSNDRNHRFVLPTKMSQRRETEEARTDRHIERDRIDSEIPTHTQSYTHSFPDSATSSDPYFYSNFDFSDTAASPYSSQSDPWKTQSQGVDSLRVEETGTKNTEVEVGSNKYSSETDSCPTSASAPQPVHTITGLHAVQPNTTASTTHRTPQVCTAVTCHMPKVSPG